MLLELIRYLRGYLRIRVTGYSPERFLNLCKNKEILVWGLLSGNNCYEMYMSVSGFRKLKPILKKTQTKVAIEERVGLPFFFYRYRKRNMFFAGAIVALVLIFAGTFFLWDIDIRGNISITDDVLFEYFEEQDLKIGTPISRVKCEDIVKDLRKNFHDIIWVSASLEGAKLTVEIKENTDTFHVDIGEKEPSDIVAEKSGVVQSIVTRNGVPLVKAGDTVKEGMVLVSGIVPILNDAKETVGYHYVNADADIILSRTELYQNPVNKIYHKKKETERKRKLITILFGEFQMEFGIRRNKFEHSFHHTSESTITIGEKISLPIKVGTVKIQEYEIEKCEYTKEEMENVLTEHFEQYCKELEDRGAVIQTKHIQIAHQPDTAYANGTIELLEEAGIPRKIVDFLPDPMVE